MSCDILAFGNPLLDIIVKCDEDCHLLSKYQLPPDGAIEAQPWQMPLFDEVYKFEHHHKPGGSAQNTCRVARSFLNEDNINVIFIGCVGKDKHAEILTELVKKSGVKTIYVYDDVEPTGISADLVHGPSRSLCANIGAAKCFQPNHLNLPEVKTALSSCAVLYIEGYFLTHSSDSAGSLVKFSNINKKTFALNLSAVYICRDFGSEIKTLFPYAHLVIGNEDEVTEFCIQSSIHTSQYMEKVSKLCELDFNGMPSEFNFFNSLKRCVIMTRGPKPIIVAIGNEVREFVVPQVPKNKLKDTVGAGDAFVGGLLAALIKGGNLDDCVKSGITASLNVIQKEGCTV